MPATIPWLTLLLVLPLCAGVATLLRRDRHHESRWYALLSALGLLAIALGLFFAYGGASSGWLLREDAAWIAPLGIRYTLEMDGLSLVLLLLTAFLQVVAILISWEVKRHPAYFFSLILLLESGINGVFLATDLFLFYVFWELMLIPIFLLIGIWGHERRFYAAIKFFLFTLAGSLLMLAALIRLYLQHAQASGVPSFALADLAATPLPAGEAEWLYAAFLIAFAIKIPLFPVHSWLPDAHTEAPVAGSVDLAGLLLKTGVFGLIRIGFVLFPAQAQASFPLLAGLGLIGLYYGAWLAWQQRDIKRMIAYSSISHLGLAVLGLASGDALALSGGMLLMIGHGVTTGGLFVCVAMIQERTATRDLDRLGGLWSRSPAFGAVFLLLCLSSLGLPGLANFSGEILVLLGLFRVHPLQGALAMAGIVFSALYMLRLLRGLLWGEPHPGQEWSELRRPEIVLLAGLVLAVLLLGLWPQPFLAPLAGPARLLVAGFGGLP